MQSHLQSGVLQQPHAFGVGGQVQSSHLGSQAMVGSCYAAVKDVVTGTLPAPRAEEMRAFFPGVMAL